MYMSAPAMQSSTSLTCYDISLTLTFDQSVQQQSAAVNLIRTTEIGTAPELGLSVYLIFVSRLFSVSVSFDNFRNVHPVLKDDSSSTDSDDWNDDDLGKQAHAN